MPYRRIVLFILRFTYLCWVSMDCFKLKHQVPFPYFHMSANDPVDPSQEFESLNYYVIILFQCISNKMQRYTVYSIWKLLYMFRVVPPPIIRSANNCIYSVWYFSHPYCYLPLSWKRWSWFECAVGGVGHPQHTQFSSNSSTIAADSNNGVTNAVDEVVCAPNDG